ncbi:MAG: fructose PTS transporter subunit IIA [Lactobacillus crispatus]|nr:fructose PTS transporter subunit IIA [Lactobacillus crispatus]
MLNENLVVFNLKANNKQQVFEKMTNLFFDNKIIQNKSKFIDAVNYREKIDTTGVGNGIAIPHGKSATVKKSAVAVAKLDQNIEWNSLDGKPVKYVFLLAIPESGDKEHLKILSEIAEKLMDENVVNDLHNAKNSKDIINAFC